MTFLLLKALHQIFIVTWFAGLFYLPRLFVYHATTEDEISLNRFKLMESRLYRIIMTPSAVLTAIFGFGLLVMTWNVHAVSVWIWMKIILVLILYIYHVSCGRLMQDLAQETNVRSEKFYRIFNELPSFLLVMIIVLVVLKPL